MTSPKFSVVIPAYNNADYLGETIQSVLDQTFPYFEVIVVNDASPDHTPEVISRLDDARIKYIVHKENKGLSAARNTGIRASSGEYIALLDGDDLFHPEKLQMHADFLQKHPEIGVTYNPRFELNHSAMTVRELWHPPLSVTLADLVMGFPFSPSDMVLRREWAFRVNLFDEYYTYVGEDLDINCRLALAGCKFARVDRALNYRRFYSGRILNNLRSCVENTIRPLVRIFADPQCPGDVANLQNVAFSTHYMLWSIIAFDQDETELGQEYLLEAIGRDPNILEGKPGQLMMRLATYSIIDECRDHDQLLRRIFSQLPAEIKWSSEEYEWAVARGYLLRGTRAILWGRKEDGQEHFKHAKALHAQIDQPFLQRLVAQLIDYENEMGLEAAQDRLRDLLPFIHMIGNRAAERWFKGCFSINRAFQNYRAGAYTHVSQEVMRAFANNPGYLANRGVMSILVRSIMGLRAQSNGEYRQREHAKSS